ncbi:cobyrinate a,c-diamide synthase [Pararhizobium haloflavum]|uniref:cobyrinate a,c-diamide synthase n=1 Tax=Pararhizobium haloflavum TaxID=2037914 RepID=UPI000C18ABDA|nr:cobyrinate a,c-diamide synthase [Pararhizobium haloflavum]
MTGLLVAAPASGQGKTTVTLGLMRALRRRGISIAPGKAGPDYIDPAFHAAASGALCLNYDPWAMRPELIRTNAALATAGGKLLVVEAMMGLFDGAADGKGCAADLAKLLRLPVVFVVDCAKMSHSIAALVSGFARFDPSVMIAGVILNRVASARHEAMLRQALAQAGIEAFGVLKRDEALCLPERHLGLVQAGEHAGLEAFVERAADAVETGCAIDAMLRTAHIFGNAPSDANIARLPPLGQRISVARDIAFAFTYEHMLLGWRRRGAEVRFFSPLAGEAPHDDADAVYLPGGYPELHAGRLADAFAFREGMHRAMRSGAVIYGECGGYMALGEGLIDAEGERHAMLGLLPLETSFAAPRRHLGYRRLKPRAGFAWSAPMTAHEFHYAGVVREGEADRLFDVRDAAGSDLGPAGLQRGRVAGSFMHVIDIEGSACA